MDLFVPVSTRQIDPPVEIAEEVGARVGPLKVATRALSWRQVSLCAPNDDMCCQVNRGIGTVGSAGAAPLERET